MIGRIAALGALTCLVAGLCPAEQPGDAKGVELPIFRVSDLLTPGFLSLYDLSGTERSVEEEPASCFRLFRAPWAPRKEPLAVSVPDGLPHQGVFSPSEDFELLHRVSTTVGLGSLEEVLEGVDTGRVLLEGPPTGPWFEEGRDLGGVLEVRYSESPLCPQGGDHRLPGTH